MTRNLPTADAVADALLDVDFPASKAELVRAAERAGAGEDVLAALRSLPLADYDNRDEVLRSVETVEATGQTPAQKAAQARASVPPGLAEHQRTTAPRSGPARG
jgi:hypothetical protein